MKPTSSGVFIPTDVRVAQPHDLRAAGFDWLPKFAMPITVTLAAAMLLWLAPAAVGLLAAIGAACAWTWWLEEHPEPEPSSRGAQLTFVSPPAEQEHGAVSSAPPRTRPRLAAHRVLVCMTPTRPANLEIQSGAALADRVHGSLMAAYVVPDGATVATPALPTNISLATAVGATVVRIQAEDVIDGLLALVEREGITHVILGHRGHASDLLDEHSVIAQFLRRVRHVEIAIVGHKPDHDTLPV